MSKKEVKASAKIRRELKLLNEFVLGICNELPININIENVIKRPYFQKTITLYMNNIMSNVEKLNISSKEIYDTVHSTVDSISKKELTRLKQIEKNYKFLKNNMQNYRNKINNTNQKTQNVIKNNSIVNISTNKTKPKEYISLSDAYKRYYK